MPGRKCMRRKNVSKGRYFRHIVFCMAALACAVLFAANLFTPDRAFSAAENRSLSARPPLSQCLTSGWGQTADRWYSDQFVLRDALVKLNSLAGRCAGQREINGVYIGKDGYLFEEPTAKDPVKTERTAKAIAAFSHENSDLSCSVILVPDAASVLARDLPANAPVSGQAGEIDEFLSLLPDSVRTLNASAALEAASRQKTEDRDEETQVFYRTDHHWTTDGAYAVFQAAQEMLNIPEPAAYSRFVVTDSFQGTLASQSADGASKDAVTIYIPDSDVRTTVSYSDLQTRRASVYMPEKLEQKDQYQVFFGGNHPSVEIETTADTGRSLLVFKDSFANSFVPFLTPYYDTIILIDPRYYYENVDAVLSSYGITDVMFLYSADTLWSDTQLADALG